MWYFKNQYHNIERIKLGKKMILTPHRGTEAVPA
jgi:hypothetical protein